MESEKRFQQICKNLCLLLTAILHFVHTMVQPVLMSISASRNTKKSSHVRVSQPSVTLIGPDPRDSVLSLVDHYYTGAKVYAIKTHLTAYKMLPY